MSILVEIPEHARRAWAALGEAIGAARNLVPCAESDDWTSEAAQIRSKAAERCGGCPALWECRSYADAAGEPFGVWAGIDRTPSRAARNGRPHERLPARTGEP